MTINADSRYASASISTVTDGRGTHQSVNIPDITTATYVFTFYQMREGDSLDALAYQAYGNGAYWWKIADLNPEILDWLDVPPGTVIRLPSSG